MRRQGSLNAFTLSPCLLFLLFTVNVAVNGGITTRLIRDRQIKANPDDLFQESHYRNKIRRRDEEDSIRLERKNRFEMDTAHRRYLPEDDGKDRTNPLQACEEGCKNANDCVDELRCKQNDSKRDIGGCPGTKGKKYFCYDPNYVENTGTDPSDTDVAGRDANTAAILSGSAWNARDPTEFPLRMCQGHCTQTSDCQTGLDCYKRLPNEFFVPGCFGQADMVGTSYCYNPLILTFYTPAPTNPPIIFTASPVTATPVTATPITLGPVAPTALPSTLAPQPRPTPFPTFDATNIKIPLVEPGNDELPFEVFPLQRCQGDCDGDSECAPGLICYFRDGIDPVPGCSGSGYPNTDYCIDKRDDPARPPIEGAFRIKMYWEKGYDWQETYREANWCFQCLNATCYGDTISTAPECYESQCDVGDIMTLRPCTMQNVWFELVGDINGEIKSVSQIETAYQNLLENRYQPFVESYGRQVAKAYYEFTRAQYAYYNWKEPPNRTYFTMPANLGSGPDEAFNRLVGGYYDQSIRDFVANKDRVQSVWLRLANTDLCLDLVGSTRMQVEPCDYSRGRQQWRPGKGNFFGKNFEIRTAASADGCLTQPHHPRDYEMIANASCYEARLYNTSLYNKY
jgi:hypothetical protein